MEPVRPRGRLNPAYRTAALLVKPPMVALTKQDWAGWEHLPTDGGFVAAPNHVSYFDPLDIAHFLFDAGTAPYFLGKEEVFRVPVLGPLLTASGQVPVHRSSGKAVDAYQAAVDGVLEGKCIVMFPEGTLTRDPDQWPMVGKTGAARVALATGRPVVPIAHWGSQEVMPTYGKGIRLFPRKTMRVAAGPAVDLADLRGRPLDTPTLREATARIMADITTLLEGLRGQTAPVERWDPRKHGQSTTGNYKRQEPR